MREWQQEACHLRYRQHGSSDLTPLHLPPGQKRIQALGLGDMALLDLLGEVRQQTSCGSAPPLLQLRGRPGPFSLGQLGIWKCQAVAGRVKLRTAVSWSSNAPS